MKPSPSWPRRLAAGTRTSSKDSSAVSWACWPSLCSLRPRSKPSIPRSTTSRLMPWWRSRGVGLGGHDHEVGVDAVGDEGLAPVDHVVVAVADRGGAHRRQVRADPGLGHRQRRDQLAADLARQPPLALSLVGQTQEVGEADVVVEGDPESEGADRQALALFPDHEVQAEVIGARPAVALGNRHRQEPAPAGRPEDLAGDDPVALPLPVAALLAQDLALQEGAEAGPEVFVEVLEQRPSHRRRSARGDPQPTSSARENAPDPCSSSTVKPIRPTAGYGQPAVAARWHHAPGRRVSVRGRRRSAARGRRTRAGK